MKRFLTPLSIAIITLASASATADIVIDHSEHDINTFNKEMSKIEVVHVNEAVTVSVAAYYLDDVVEVTEFMSLGTQLKQISDQQAEKLGLMPFKSYLVHSLTSIEELSQKASVRLMQDNPNYFSATLLEGDKYLEGHSEYIAKITEYSVQEQH
jgi:hypothetical protein